jgi:hypothetical protein
LRNTISTHNIISRWSSGSFTDNANFVRAATCGRPRGSAAASFGVAGGNVTGGTIGGGTICGPAVEARAGAEGIRLPAAAVPHMTRPKLEVADIFRRHGEAWRTANVGHLSLAQRRVMTAIETCRTAALGGHVEQCEINLVPTQRT